MSFIRGRHNTPGIYSRIKPKKDEVKVNNFDGGTSGFANWNTSFLSHTIWYGFYPAQTLMGQETGYTYDLLNTVTPETILHDGINFNRNFDSGSIIIGNIGKNITIEKEMVSEFSGVTDWEEYQEVCDEHNKCLVLIVSNEKYEAGKIEVFDYLLYNLPDKTFNFIEQFTPLHTVVINNHTYRILALLDKNYAYAPVNKEKIISPIIIKIR